MAKTNRARRPVSGSRVGRSAASDLVAAAERHGKRKPGQYNPADATVEMFKAIKAGDIEVKLIPKRSPRIRPGRKS